MEKRSRASLYKGKYAIIFYDLDGWFADSFDNVRELVSRGQGKPCTKQNLMAATMALCYALKKGDHKTTILGGKPMTVYLLDIDKEN